MARAIIALIISALDYLSSVVLTISSIAVAAAQYIRMFQRYVRQQLLQHWRHSEVLESN